MRSFFKHQPGPLRILEIQNFSEEFIFNSKETINHISRNLSDELEVEEPQRDQFNFGLLRMESDGDGDDDDEIDEDDEEEFDDDSCSN